MRQRLGQIGILEDLARLRRGRTRIGRDLLPGGIVDDRAELLIGLPKLGQKRRAFLRNLIGVKLVELAVDLGEHACRRFGYLRGVDSCYALVGRVEQAVEAGHDAVEVEVLQLLDDFARR